MHGVVRRHSDWLTENHPKMRAARRRAFWRSFALFVSLGLLTGCSSAHEIPGPTLGTSHQHTSPAVNSPFVVSSNELASGRWPAAATCDGDDNPPDLQWTAGPDSTVSYAVKVVDTDVPNGGYTHWMLANEPADLRQPTPGTGVSGKNDFGNEGYGGPCPPHGTTHHYVVTVYALNAMLHLQLLYRRADFERALDGHVRAQSSIAATYTRS